MFDYSFASEIGRLFDRTKLAAKIAVVGIAFTTGIFVGKQQAVSNDREVCWQENYGWCQEGLDWDNVSESVQEKNDMLCQEFTTMYCQGDITNEKYRELVANLQE